MTPPIRELTPEDQGPLAQLWHDGWREAHLEHVPEALHAKRSLMSFAERLNQLAPDARCAGPIGAPLGMCIVKGAEIDQLYVAPAARGSGLARDLLTDGEARIRAAGHRQARLHAIPENKRGLRFYEKCGWTIGPVEMVAVDTLDGSFSLPCVVLTKDL